MKQQFLSIICLGVSVVTPVAHATPADKGVEDILACMNKNVLASGSIQGAHLISINQKGRSKKLKFNAFWRPSKNNDKVDLTLQVTAPRTQAGGAYLFQKIGYEEKTHIYFPVLRGVRTFSGQDKTKRLWGSDFNLDDIRMAQGALIAGSPKRMGDGSISGRPVYILETQGTAESEYKLVRSYIDQQNCQTVKADFYVKGNKPSKTFTGDVSTLIEIKSHWFIKKFKLTDNDAGTYSTLEFNEINTEGELLPDLFTRDGFFIT